MPEESRRWRCLVADPISGVRWPEQLTLFSSLSDHWSFDSDLDLCSLRMSYCVLELVNGKLGNLKFTIKLCINPHWSDNSR